MDLSAIESLAVSVVTDVAKALTSDSATTTSANAASQTTTQDGIESLVSVADSLISSVYPSATLTNLGSLTWPSTVVIGSSTYIIHSSSQTGLTTSATPTSNSAVDSSSLSSAFAVSSNAVAVASSTPGTDSSGSSSSGSISSKSYDPWDKRLGIILGVVLGCIALFVFLFLVWFVRRRNKKTGSFFKQRRSSTPSDDEVFSWRNTEAGEKHGENPALVQQPMAAHSMFASRSWTRDDDGLAYPGNELAPVELATNHSARGSTEQNVNDRPSTPFSPAEFAAMARSPVSPMSSSQHNAWPQTPSELHDTNPFLRPQESQELEDTQVRHDIHPGYPQTRHQNPFSSPEDDEDEESDSMLEPPNIPSRSPRRRSSPQVLYPSGEELDRFRFWA